MMNNAVRVLLVFTLALTVNLGGCGDNSSNDTPLEDATGSSDTENSDAKEDSVSDPCEGIDCGTGGACNAGACVCDAGYEVDADGVCTDIDECLSDNGGCDANAACTNTDGSFSCACKSGFTGDGLSCTDDDECALDTDNCDANAACTNTVGSFSCACKSGFTGDGLSCTDVDECSAGDEVVCGTGGSCSQTSDGTTSAVNTYYCACATGYQGGGEQTACADINECALDTDNCDANATCTNTDGYWNCDCNSGYTGDGITCTDIDECAGVTCDNGGTCFEADGETTPGNYSCTCAAGYEGGELNNTVCTDIDECLVDNGDCGDETYWLCTNIAGGPPTCGDLDECATNNGGCADECSNHELGYTCTTNVYVDTVSSIEDGDISTGEFSLPEAVTFNNSLPAGNNYRIRFSPSLAGQTIVLAAPLVVTNDLIVDGEALNISISGDNQFSVFGIFGADKVSIANVTIRDGRAVGKASEFVNWYICLAAGAGAGLGGGVYLDSGNLELSSVTFLENTAVGGASTPHPYDSYNPDLTCANGGHSNWGSGGGSGSDTSPDQNGGYGGGGGSGMCADEGGSVVDPSGSGGVGGGGGTGWDDDGTLCPAGKGGFGGADGGNYATCSGSNCADDSGAGAGLGGGLHVRSGTATVTGCSFQTNSVTGGVGTSANSATGYGGAIFVYGVAMVTGSGNTFIGNSQQASGDGADLYCYNASASTDGGNLTCNCLPGYAASPDGVCLDANECTLTDPCDPNATCANTIGSFTCTCEDGYSGDGVSCTDIDECANGICDPNATCQNSFGSYTCECMEGYSGSGLAGQCPDIDECATDTDDCDPNATCTNSAGSFVCTCLPGFTCN